MKGEAAMLDRVYSAEGPFYAGLRVAVQSRDTPPAIAVQATVGGR